MSSSARRRASATGSAPGRFAAQQIARPARSPRTRAAAGPRRRSAACAPSGTLQPPPSASRNTRSAATARAVGAWCRRAAVAAVVLVVFAALQHDRALAGRRDEACRVERLGDLRRAAQPLQAGHGQHDRVVSPLAQLAQARVHVAAQVFQHEVGTRPRATVRAGAGWWCRRARPSEAPASAWPPAETSASRGSARSRVAARRSPRAADGHVLQAVDGQIHLPGQHGLLDLLEEGALARRRPPGAGPGCGRPRGDDHGERRLVPEAAQQPAHVFGLPERQRAAARADADGFHGLTSRGACAAG